MSDDYAVDVDRNKAQFLALREAIPDIVGGYGQLHKSAMSEGAVSAKTKELIALAIGIHTKCEGCMLAHIKAALHHGATREEIAETIGVAIMMGGGPSVSYGSKALAMAEHFVE